PPTTSIIRPCPKGIRSGDTSSTEHDAPWNRSKASANDDEPRSVVAGTRGSSAHERLGMLAEQATSRRAIAGVEGLEDRVVGRGEFEEVGLDSGEPDPDSRLEPQRVPGLEQDLVTCRFDDPSM